MQHRFMQRQFMRKQQHFNPRDRAATARFLRGDGTRDAGMGAGCEESG